MLGLTLLLVAAGAPDLVHAEGPAVAQGDHVHADSDAGQDHDHVAAHCASACQVAPALMPELPWPPVPSLPNAVAPDTMPAPRAQGPTPDPHPPRQCAVV